MILLKEEEHPSRANEMSMTIKYLVTSVLEENNLNTNNSKEGIFSTNDIKLYRIKCKN